MVEEGKTPSVPESQLRLASAMGPGLHKDWITLRTSAVGIGSYASPGMDCRLWNCLMLLRCFFNSQTQRLAFIIDAACR